MRDDQSKTCPFRVEMTSIVESARASAGLASREASFTALSRLERLALTGGASDATLREIAEARFLAGILRDSVRAAKPARLRAILRARSAPRDPTATRLDTV